MSDLIDKAEAKAALQAWLDRHNYPVNPTLFHALDALPARGVGVKPLVWKREADNAWVAAHYAIHQYWPHNSGPFAVSGYLGGLGAISVGKHPTLEAAKAAAQADYEARILAALSTTDYTLAPHLQKIVDGAKTAPQWDMQADRLAPTDAAHVNETPKSEHDAGNVLTDAAQAREAALMEAHKAILAMDTKKDEDLTYNLAVLRAAEKVRRLISEART